MKNESPPAVQAEVLGTLLEHRYSCRGYLGRQVPREDIEHILRLAQRTPSWCNSQPWQVIITSGASTARLAAALLEAAQAGDTGADFDTPAEYRGVYRERRRQAAFGMYRHAGIERGDHARRVAQTQANFGFFGAPHTAIITTDGALGTYGALDCGAYVSTFLLAAQSLGIAAVAQGAIAMVSDAVRSHLQIPADRRIVCAVSFGYADPLNPINDFRSARAELSEVVQWA